MKCPRKHGKTISPTSPKDIMWLGDPRPHLGALPVADFYGFWPRKIPQSSPSNDGLPRSTFQRPKRNLGIILDIFIYIQQHIREFDGIRSAGLNFTLCKFLSQVLVTPTTQAQAQFGQTLGPLDHHR
jgi:hypothetical protein